MKKRFFFAMMALAALFVTVGFTSCGSDDDNTPMTSAEVKCYFNFLNDDLEDALNFGYLDNNGKAVWMAKSGYISKDGVPVVTKIKDNDGKELSLYTVKFSFNQKTFTSFPATYSFTSYVKIWIDLDKATDVDIYDYFVNPYFTVKTNVDSEEKIVKVGDPGYTYIPKVNFKEVNTDAELKAKIEGKITCTLNIDKDGNCTATQKFEKFDGTEKLN